MSAGAEQPGRGRRSDLRDLLGRARPHRRVLLVATALGLVGTAGSLAQPLAAKWVIDALGRHHSLVGPVVLLIVLVLAGAGVLMVQGYLLERTAELVVLGARVGLVSRLLRLRMAELDYRPPGDLLARVSADTTLLRTVTTSGLVEAVNGVVSLLGALALMAFLDPVLLSVTVVVLLGLVGVMTLLLPRIRRATERGQKAIGALTESLQRALGAVRTVRASGATDRETTLVSDAAAEAYRQGITVARYSAVVGVSSGLAVQVAFLVVLGLGGVRVAAGQLAVSSLIAFLLYLFYLGSPISALVGGANLLQQGLAAVGRLRELEELPVEDDLPAADMQLRQPDSHASGEEPIVRFEAVSFRYAADAPFVLDGASFAVARTGQTALVGPSGAGKTTVFSLLERFYDPVEGRILLDGHDLLGLPRDEVRRTLGYVEQDTPVLSGTLGENLRYAAPSASDAELDEALVAAGLREFVDRLPEGLETPVGSRGLTLSGGQRQRIAIARALLRKPRLLLLDEVTAQLDAVNERALRTVIEDVSRERAVLVIAHRLSTVRAAEQIVVLDGGRVRAVGTHDELVRADSLYAELASTQLLAPR